MTRLHLRLSALACAALLLAAAVPGTATPVSPAASAAPAPAQSGSASPHPAAITPPQAILVFTRTRGWRHDSIPQAVDTLRALAAQAGLDVVHSEDPELFEDASLARFDAVVFANTTGDVLDAAQQAAFQRYIAGGGGFMGVHSAADTHKQWPWYGDLVGAWFKNHPPGLQTAPVRFESGRGPGGLQRWQVTDELYNYRRNPRPAVEVIATVDESGYAGGTMGSDHPIAWCQAAAGGRAWYTGLGHDPALYADPVFREHLLRGLRYATGRSDDC
ncbi:ThuA domain-containing protein [Pseudoxanthomonas kaohsiungensis]|uniref:ThuA domain-containing protein n=1 Tax=Pseudoxanthomonas kaohsiungensis TaxID=283923 RepID=A0ABW3M123_9GAMM|nr:ThuA domain-containing protein [Pseudoxanthomonas kaohsiungensis]KAF1701391.1 Crp/Fnr family transcriptional regulator [Pseudoxanthomonas kaohsiungensis]